MTDKKMYKSALRSQRFIRQAFMELIKEKKLDKITVTDIVSKADINRSTFYAHYSDVKALVEEIQTEFVDNSIQLIKDADFLELLKHPVPLLRRWIDIANENRDFYTFLGRTAASTNLIEQIKIMLVEKAMNMEQIPENIRNQKNFEIRVNFFVGGIINVYQQYLIGNLDASSEEIVADIAELIKNSAPTVLQVTTP